MSGVEWGKLVTQGRAKAFGVPWSAAESNAVYTLSIPADYVRKGCLNTESYEAMKQKEAEQVEKTGRVPLKSLRVAQLFELAQQKGLPVTPDATKEVLIEVLVADGSPKSIPVEDVPPVKE